MPDSPRQALEAAGAHPPQLTAQEWLRKTELPLPLANIDKGTINPSQVPGSPRTPRGMSMEAERKAKETSHATAEAAIIWTQAHWRGYKSRKSGLFLRRHLHLGYEVRIFELRKERSKLVVDFIGHILFLVLLIGVFFMQHGRTVNNRNVLVSTIKDEINNIVTPDGLGLDAITNVGDFLIWTDSLASTVQADDGGSADASVDEGEAEAGAAEQRRRKLEISTPYGRAPRRKLKASNTGGGGSGGGRRSAGGGGGLGAGRSYLRTYNQIVGSIRLEGVRVTNTSCPWRESTWNEVLLTSRRGLLYESDKIQQECFGARGPGAIMTKPYGPWYDTTKYTAENSRYIVDLGMDPALTRLKLTELEGDEFVSPATRRMILSLTLYNNALPMLCFVRIVCDVSPTGAVRVSFFVEGMNVAEYMGESWWLQLALEILLFLWTVRVFFREFSELRANGILAHFSQIWNLLSMAQMAMYFAAMAQWIMLFMDLSRDLDLDTREYVDLEEVATIITTCMATMLEPRPPTHALYPCCPPLLAHVSLVPTCAYPRSARQPLLQPRHPHRPLRDAPIHWRRRPHGDAYALDW